MPMLLATALAIALSSAAQGGADLAAARAGADSTTAAAGTPFPRPAALAPQVAFWTRIYSAYTTFQMVVHDSKRLDVVYAIIDVPPAGTEVAADLRRRRLEEVRETYELALKHLAEAPADEELTDIERAARAAWGEETAPEDFQAAAGRVRAQVGQADRFREGVRRAGAYLPHMRAIFAELGLPEELLALPHVESSFDPSALSHRGASGIWQWTRSTGRLFMRIDRLVDERRDPLLSTRASARCLRAYYEELGSWPLAITAYNHGLQGMRRAVEECGPDLATIIRDYEGRAFRFASRNFYAEFLAALDVAGDIERHFGGPVEADSLLAFDSVRLPRAVSLARAATRVGARPEELAALNPALLDQVVSGRHAVPEGYELRVPAGRGAALAAALGVPGAAASWPPRDAAADSLAMAADQEPSSDPGSDSDPATTTYRVRPGDTLTVIARRHTTTIRVLRELNGLDSDRIVAGQVLRVPAAAPP